MRDHIVLGLGAPVGELLHASRCLCWSLFAERLESWLELANPTSDSGRSSRCDQGHGSFIPHLLLSRLSGFNPFNPISYIQALEILVTWEQKTHKAILSQV